MPVHNMPRNEKLTAACAAGGRLFSRSRLRRGLSITQQLRPHTAIAQPTLLQSGQGASRMKGQTGVSRNRLEMNVLP